MSEATSQPPVIDSGGITKSRTLQAVGLIHVCSLSNQQDAWYTVGRQQMLIVKLLKQQMLPIAEYFSASRDHRCLPPQQSKQTHTNKDRYTVATRKEHQIIMYEHQDCFLALISK